MTSGHCRVSVQLTSHVDVTVEIKLIRRRRGRTRGVSSEGVVFRNLSRFFKEVLGFLYSVVHVS